MRLGDLELTPDETFDRNTLEQRFDRGMTGRGIEICYDEDEQRYLRLFSSDESPYNDDVRGGQFTYIGEGLSGDQELKAGNRYLAESVDTPIPIFFFHREDSRHDWEYQGQVEVVDYEYVRAPSAERMIYRFTLQRRDEGRETVDPDEGIPDLTRPRRTEVTKSRIVRNSEMVNRLKRLYGDRCQICGDERRRSPDEAYSEGHHLRPLGQPHDGPDEAANVLILCPNHHADFDYGMIEIEPKTHQIAHAYDAEVDGASLSRKPEHDLDPTFLEYHNRWIADF